MGGLFGKKKAQPAPTIVVPPPVPELPPEIADKKVELPEPVMPMPDAGDTFVNQRKRRQASVQAQQRSGRLSTILSERGGTEKLGGG